MPCVKFSVSLPAQDFANLQTRMRETARPVSNFIRWALAVEYQTTHPNVSPSTVRELSRQANQRAKGRKI